MQAVKIRSFGDAHGLAVVDMPEPVVGPGHVLIETEAIGVGGVDAVIRRGTLGTGFAVGLIPGSEVAGRVIEVGDGVDPTWIGQRVWAFTGLSGGYAERAIAAVDDVTSLPADLSMIDAVTLGTAGPVAHFALAHARFTTGQSVLVRGAAGSIGIMAVQLAAAGGAKEIGVTTSSPERGHRLRAFGATSLLDRSGKRHEGGESAPSDLVFDLVGGEAMPTFFEHLAPNGRMVSVGVVAGYPPADFGMPLMRAFQKSLSFGTFSLDTVPVLERNLVRADQFEAAARGVLRAVVHDVLPLAKAEEAHRRMDAGEVFGRIVLTP
ncbi:zinc-binding dehydrogenase [Lacisediminihabitans sp.]|uniref:zinc-binding dehydrogenase n=1 Tax=Lacisediminihabitans sp. TaxID=2787631 RepID=UPI00374DA9C9